MKRKILVSGSIGVLVLTMLVLGLWYTRPGEMDDGIAVPALMSFQYKDPGVALKYGILGYVEISLPQDSPLRKENQLPVKRGGEINIPLLLTFVSHTPELKEVGVVLDPTLREGVVWVEKYYVVTDEKGNVVKRDRFIVNDYLSYNLKRVLIKAGETLPVILTVHIPQDFPPVSSFTLNPFGIKSENRQVVAFSDMKAKVHWEVIIP